MKIAKIDYRKLRNDAHFQLNTEVRKLIQEEGASKLKIKDELGGLV